MTEEKTKYCPHCGAQIEYRYAVCPACGKPQPPIDGVIVTPRKHGRNPWLAFILSLLVTGVGQFYVGKVMRGLTYLGGVLLISYALDGVLTFDQLTILGAAISIISAVDAYRLAKETSGAAN